MTNLITAILEGDCAESVSQAKSLLGGGVSPEQVVTDGIEAAMSRLDAKCTLEQFNLLEIMLAGRAVMEIMKLLYPSGIAMAASKGTVVIATLEGDIHDLGKNILKTVLIGKGYRVVDCGKDCPLQKLIDIVEKERPLAVAISGLITPIIPLVRQVKDMLLLRRLDCVKVIAGGAALKQSSASRLNVDFLAESAFDVLPYLDEFTGGRK
ncbi:MAG: cobalamin-dependent protein [Nitrospirota bacterium]